MALTRIYANQDQSIISSTTLVGVNDLVVPMKQYGSYLIKSVVFFDTSAAADFKYRHTGSAAATRVRILRRVVIPGDTVFSGLLVDTAYSGADITVLGAGTTGGILMIDAIITNGSAQSNFSIQFAQNASTATNTTILAGSYIEYEQVKGKLY